MEVMEGLEANLPQQRDQHLSDLSVLVHRMMFSVEKQLDSETGTLEQRARDAPRLPPEILRHIVSFADFPTITNTILPEIQIRMIYNDHNQK